MGGSRRSSMASLVTQLQGNFRGGSFRSRSPSPRAYASPNSSFRRGRPALHSPYLDRSPSPADTFPRGKPSGRTPCRKHCYIGLDGCFLYRNLLTFYCRPLTTPS